MQKLTEANEDLRNTNDTLDKECKVLKAAVQSSKAVAITKDLTPATKASGPQINITMSQAQAAQAPSTQALLEELSLSRRQQ